MRAVMLSNELVDLLKRIFEGHPIQHLNGHSEEYLFYLLEHIEKKAKSIEGELLRKELAHLADQIWSHIDNLAKLTYPDQPPIEVD
ncbi:MAG: hypothetical protein A3A98_02080 [Candidatus Staskawiczbacteria bacterium RIFCSPLOWO2_01_FULL_40_39]|uniref:Uncharacterized protein n=1 Tax=Candidatus Staskawiczbacteria bacterium RIFCSPHIGHO2_01_FULL_39_25 TaxID=1802202 RepID=A0A1G2HQJ1_9BACT|nr:MAG: hypothetical protein A2730_02235 [Candidatus Staskawiczbacteria bacterium RIFCSPHIGHO2_01_FULL_39_25]OGZ72755.1 MAG: hypothetical protein A3A98_02080 [Candidatus Staskawiczbacteria bacterium RIFCSPLOWO2_01_FULL_40_39]OGZ76747.1 MAG: hypothetical protein A3I87_02470 [Candidatus Staskawiczbacteria bacterium RIFCSPLOWO2_02_FULL_39_8]